MNYGLVMRTDVNLGELPKLAYEAEAAGWDAFFVWDGFLSVNPWVVLSTVALCTKRLRFGVMLTAASVRRPWQLASETATLDQLSEGRLILCLGLGAADDLGFGRVGEQTDRKVRAELLDESIDILQGLWTGQPFSYVGKHYHLDQVTLAITPVQQPQIPIWVVGAWPRQKSMQRVLRCQGLIPAKMTAAGASTEVTPAELQAMVTFLHESQPQRQPYAVVFEGETTGHAVADRCVVASYARAGATWWLECVAASAYRAGGLAGVRARIAAGPPYIE
jgi:hypothetical protein